MISAFWMIGILFGIAGVCTAFSRRKIEEWFAFAIFAIIAVLYVFALCGVPVAGYHTVRALGVAALAAGLMKALRSCEVRRRLFTPGALVFAVWILIAWWAHRGQMYNTYDEFNHWGRSVNRLYVLKQLPSAIPGALDYPSYPPGTTLFYCFFTWLGGAFSEGSTLTAANIFLGACMMPLMKCVNWKQWKHIVPMACVCILVPMVFKPTAYQDLYVDVLLGCVAGHVLITWFASQHDKARVLIIALASGALCMIKESGAGIAALILCVLAMNALRLPQDERKKAIWTVFTATVATAAAVVSWKCFLSAHDIVSEKPFRYWEIATNLQAFLGGKAPNSLRDQYRNFFSHLTSSVMMGGGHLLSLNYLEWLLVFWAVGCWLRRRGEEGIDACQATWALAGTTVIYAVMLYHIYLYSFTGSERIALHSFERYMSSIMTAALCGVFALVAESMRCHPPKMLPASVILLLCTALVVSPWHVINLTFGAPYHIRAVQAERGKASPSAHVLDRLQENDCVAWLSSLPEGDPFLIYLCNRYEFLPVQMEAPCGHLQTEQQVEDIQKCLLESECTHVYCYRVDEVFVQEYGELFENVKEINDTTLYEIIRTEHDLRLRKVL